MQLTACQRENYNGPVAATANTRVTITRYSCRSGIDKLRKKICRFWTIFGQKCLYLPSDILFLSGCWWVRLARRLSDATTSPTVAARDYLNSAEQNAASAMPMSPRTICLICQSGTWTTTNAHEEMDARYRTMAQNILRDVNRSERRVRRLLRHIGLNHAPCWRRC